MNIHCRNLPYSVLSWLYWFDFKEPVIFDAILDIKNSVYVCKILFASSRVSKFTWTVLNKLS